MSVKYGKQDASSRVVGGFSANQHVGKIVGQIIHRILVADHQPICRAGLSAMFMNYPGISDVREASDFSGALATIGREPDISLLAVDLDLPGMAGGEGLRRLRMEHNGLLVVVVASTRDRNLVLDALCAGVHGYIPKDLPVDEMLAAFRAVLSGQIFVPALVSDVTANRSDPIVQRAQLPGNCLTGRQLDVLSQLSAGKSNKEIARALKIAESTVKVHITAAFRALGVHNRVSAAAAMRGQAVRQDGDLLIPGLLAEERVERRGWSNGHDVRDRPALAS